MSTDTDTVYSFESSHTAWSFTRACDAAEIPAGCPSLKTHTVRVVLTTACDCGVKSDDPADHVESCARYALATSLANAARMVGCYCHHDGEEGQIVELKMAAVALLAVEFPGGRVALLKPTEIGRR